MHRPWGKVQISLTEFLSGKECNDSRKSLLFLVFTPVYRMFAEFGCVVASGFGMPFNRGTDIPISSRLVLSPPRLPTSFSLSNICKGVSSTTHFVYNSRFRLFFCRSVISFLTTCPCVFSGLKAVLMFSRFKSV